MQDKKWEKNRIRLGKTGQSKKKGCKGAKMTGENIAMRVCRTGAKATEAESF